MHGRTIARMPLPLKQATVLGENWHSPHLSPICPAQWSQLSNFNFPFSSVHSSVCTLISGNRFPIFPLCLCVLISPSSMVDSFACVCSFVFYFNQKTLFVREDSFCRMCPYALLIRPVRRPVTGRQELRDLSWPLFLFFSQCVSLPICLVSILFLALSSILRPFIIFNARPAFLLLFS